MPGSELGALQNAIWVRQFSALRDGDRYFYLNDPSLSQMSSAYGISYRQTLAHIVTADAGPAAAPNLFRH